MTPMRVKSFKTRNATDLDELINAFLESEKVSEICHVATGGATNSMITTVTIFYKSGAKKQRRQPVVEATIKNENKEVSNG